MLSIVQVSMPLIHIPTIEDAQHFQVDGQLDIPLHQFARNVRQIDEMIDGLVEDAGLYPEYNRYSQCNRK